MLNYVTQIATQPNEEIGKYTEDLKKFLEKFLYEFNQ